jgi:16S rRNA (adenine1518-N6/adenine1519-N6)-dimethyltransferase
LPPSINYNSKRELKAFLEERGLGMRKKFGQNFLINPAARGALLDALELQAGNEVWEIGPGLGAMTAGLLEKGGRVTAFEIDPAFANVLRESFAENASFRLVEGDVFKTWPTVKPGAAGEELYLFGNLPYNIAAAILADFIEKGRFFKRMVVTVQLEIAGRMAAKPLSGDYSSFSVLCQSAYKISLLNKIGGSSFYPAPRVDSRGARLDLLPSEEKRSAFFYPLVRSLFSSRRKAVRNTLSAFASQAIMERGLSASFTAKEVAAEALRRAGISGERRPETLDINDFAFLALCLEDLVNNGF